PIGQGPLEPGPQPRKRCLQIMRDIVSDFAHPSHKTFDLLQHPIEVGSELIKLVPRAVERDTVREVAGHYALAGSVDLLYAMQQFAAHQGAADQTGAKCDQAGPDKSRSDLAAKRRRVADVPADQQPVAARNDEQSAARGMNFGPPFHLSLKRKG